MMSIPGVTMATAKSSSPTIGRMKTRSRTIPIDAAASKARRTARIQVTASFQAAGMANSSLSTRVANEATRNAPRAASAPWAKLSTCVALKMITKPMANNV